MPMFRKKPVVISAEQFEWKDGHGIPDIAGVKFTKWELVRVGENLLQNAPLVETACIETKEGSLHVSRGDWIITGVQGEKYPCKPDIFAATYDPV